MKKLFENISFGAIAIAAIIIIVISAIVAVIIGSVKEFHMYIFHHEKYKAMRKASALERYYNYGKEDSLYY